MKVSVEISNCNWWEEIQHGRYIFHSHWMWSGFKSITCVGVKGSNTFLVSPYVNIISNFDVCLNIGIKYCDRFFNWIFSACKTKSLNRRTSIVIESLSVKSNLTLFGIQTIFHVVFEWFLQFNWKVNFIHDLILPLFIVCHFKSYNRLNISGLSEMIETEWSLCWNDCWWFTHSE